MASLLFNIVNRFKAKIFPPNIYLPHDSVYRQRRYLRTINRFNSLGHGEWLVLISCPDKTQLISLIRLTPAKKYSFNTNLEGSINQSATFRKSFVEWRQCRGYKTRNFAKAANQPILIFVTEVELGKTSG
jgi:hypothetical protein